MKSGTCPKCGQHQVYKHHGNKMGSETVALNDSVFTKGVFPDKYICVVCGYLEYYLPPSKDMDFIKENWDKVSS